MEEVLPFVGKVLEQRKKDLSVSGWNDEKQEEFYKIMGLKGTEEMVQSFTEISNVSEEITSSIDNVASVTEQQNASMEDISKASESLTRMAEELKDLISRFNTEEK